MTRNSVNFTKQNYELNCHETFAAKNTIVKKGTEFNFEK